MIVCWLCFTLAWPLLWATCSVGSFTGSYLLLIAGQQRYWLESFSVRASRIWAGWLLRIRPNLCSRRTSCFSSLQLARSFGFPESSEGGDHNATCNGIVN